MALISLILHRHLHLPQDEHGQSMLHFAAARTHGRNALIQLIEESGGNIAYRDELYRTPRDVAIQAGQPANAKEIDRYVMSLAARGDLDSFQNLFNDGYDHVLNITDPENNTVIAVCKARGHGMLLDFLEGLQELEVIFCVSTLATGVSVWQLPRDRLN